MRLEPKEQQVYDIVLSKGPVTPVDVAKDIGTTSMIAAAILSTLAGRGFIKVSGMKYGTSKLYYASGQESRVREILKSTLSPLQIKAVDLIKEARVLLDEDVSPQLRLFFSELPDFVRKLEVSFEGKNFVIWVHWTVSEDEIKKFFEYRFGNVQQPKKEPEPQEEQKVNEKQEKTEEKKVKKQKIKKNTVEPNEFVKNVLNKFNFNIIKKRIKKNEAELVVELENQLSSEKVIVWIKPNANNSDLMKAYIKSIDKKMNVYLITNSDLKNKFEEFVKVLKI